MKNWMIIFVLGVASLAFQACDNKTKTSTETKASDDISVNEVPQAVQSAFAAKYAGAADVKWENAQENSAKTYKAKFTLNGNKMKAEFNPDGSFVKED